MILPDFLAERPVFTRDQFVAFHRANGSGNGKTQAAHLDYYVRTGRVVRIRRGLYAAVPRNADPATFPVDPFLVASRLADDAVLAYHTALALHGRAHSVHRRLLYLTAHRPAPLSFRGTEYQAVSFPCPRRAHGPAGASAGLA